MLGGVILETKLQTQLWRWNLTKIQKHIKSIIRLEITYAVSYRCDISCQFKTLITDGSAVTVSSPTTIQQFPALFPKSWCAYVCVRACVW